MTKKSIYTISFSRSTRAGRRDYSKNGDEIYEITTSDGKVFKRIEDGVEDECLVVSTKTEFVDDERQRYIVTLSIFDEKVLPLEIFGNNVHIYTAQGCGTDGSREAFYVYVSKNGTGKIIAEESAQSKIGSIRR